MCKNLHISVVHPERMNNRGSEEKFSWRFGERTKGGTSRQEKWIKIVQTEPYLFLKPAGYWFIGCDDEILDNNGLTELGRVLAAAKELINEGVFIQASYKRSLLPVFKNSAVYTTPVVNCFIKNYLDIEAVIHSAEEFKKKINYPHPLYLKTSWELDDGHLENAVEYLYCCDGNLYESVHGRIAVGFRLIR